MSGHERSTHDDGAVLVLTLILTVILAMVVLAVAEFAATGLRTSDVTTARTDSNAGASAAMTWVIDEFAAKRFIPDNDCTTADTPLSVPSNLLDGASATVTCSPSDEADNYPAVELVAVTPTTGANRRIEVLLQVPRTTFNAQVRTWHVD